MMKYSFRSPDVVQLLTDVQEVSDNDEKLIDTMKVKTFTFNVLILTCTVFLLVRNILGPVQTSLILILTILLVALSMVTYRFANVYKQKLSAQISSEDFQIADDVIYSNSIKEKDIKNLVKDAYRYMILYHVIEVLNIISFLVLVVMGISTTIAIL